MGTTGQRRMEIPEWRGGGEGDSKVGDRLFEAQRGQLEELLTEYGDCSNWLIIEHATGHGACAVTSLGNT